MQPSKATDPKDKMRLTISSGEDSQQSPRSWQDTADDRIEKHLREIAIELIVRGEQLYRDSRISLREWRIQRKAEIEQYERQRQIEEERKRKERQAKLEQQRVDHLLRHANALHQAKEIRAYVAAVWEANKTAPKPMSSEELNSWSEWALAQADRIDPVLSGLYKTRPAVSND